MEESGAYVEVLEKGNIFYVTTTSRLRQLVNITKKSEK
jgi:hypothetical protein